jgi:hypothetical protein
VEITDLQGFLLYRLVIFVRFFPLSALLFDKQMTSKMTSRNQGIFHSIFSQKKSIKRGKIRIISGTPQPPPNHLVPKTALQKAAIVRKTASQSVSHRPLPPYSAAFNQKKGKNS